MSDVIRYNPKRLNAWAFALFKICAMVVNGMYRLLSGVLTTEMEKEYDMIIDNLTSDASENEILVDGKISIRVSRFVGNLIKTMDFIILLPVTILLAIVGVFVVKMWLFG
jgi:hypothetical protein